MLALDYSLKALSQVAAFASNLLCPGEIGSDQPLLANMVFYFTTSEGYMIYMGADKYENEDLIRYGIPEDLW